MVPHETEEPPYAALDGGDARPAAHDGDALKIS